MRGAILAAIVLGTAGCEPPNRAPTEWPLWELMTDVDSMTDEASCSIWSRYEERPHVRSVRVSNQLVSVWLSADGEMMSSASLVRVDSNTAFRTGDAPHNTHLAGPEAARLIAEMAEGDLIRVRMSTRNLRAPNETIHPLEGFAAALAECRAFLRAAELDRG